MKLLAIETSTEACSVALWNEGEVTARFEVAPRRHSTLVLPWAEQLLADSGLARSALDGFACGRGPGAFTGVRLAVALVQGMALALDRPVVGVSTLAALAHAAPGAGPVLAAIDARMGEVYACGFDRGGLVPLPWAAETVLPPDQVPMPAVDVTAVGTGFSAADGLLAQRLRPRLLACVDDALPRAEDVAALAVHAFAAGQAVDAEQLQPAYLRDRVALTISERAAARGDAGQGNPGHHPAAPESGA